MSQTPDHLTTSDLDGAILLGDQTPPPAHSGSHEIPISLKKLVAGGFRARRLITLCVLVGGVSAAGMAVMEPNTYVSHAAVLVQGGHEGIQVDPLLNMERSVPKLTGNAPHILLSPEVAANVVERVGARKILKPYEPPEQHDNPVRELIYNLQRNIHRMEELQFTDEGALAVLLGRLTITTPAGGSSVIYINYEAYDPQDAQDILNVILEEAKQKHEEVYGDEDLIEIEAAVHNQALLGYAEAQDAYEAFLDEVGIIDFALELDDRQRKVQEVREEHETMVLLEQDLRTRREFMQTQLESLTPIIQTEKPVVVPNPKIEPLQDAIEEMEQDLVFLKISVRDPEDPALKNVRAALAELMRSLAEANENPTIASIQVETEINPRYEQIQTQIAALDVDLAVTQGSIEPARLRIAPAEAALEQLTQFLDEERGFQRLLDNTLDHLTAAEGRMFTADHKQELQGRALSSIKILNRPSLAIERFGPNRGKSTAVGLVLGMVIGLGLSFLRTVLDGTIRSAGDLEQIGDVPVLATVPKMTRRNLARHRKARLSGC